MKELINKILSLKLPENEYAAFGSVPLALLGIRDSSDIDLIVSENIYNNLLNSGWVQNKWENGGVYLEKDDFQVTRNWKFDQYNPDIDKLIEDSVLISGVPCVKLEEVRKWKIAFGREKDLRDVNLIDEYLSK